MRIGEQKHEAILKLTIDELSHQGYKVIDLKGKSPSAIAVKDNVLYAFVICKKGKRTLTEIEDTYSMFDEVLRISYESKYEDEINKIKSLYTNNLGYNFILLNGKSPDAIATKDSKLYAIEVLGFSTNDITNMQNKQVKDKRDIYDIFDGVMIRTFKNNSEELEYFTEYYGGNNLKFHSPPRGLGGSNE